MAGNASNKNHSHFKLVAALQQRIASLEGRFAEQESTIRHTLTMLIEWIETEDYQRAAA